ncbi:uncharacterized protein LOC108100216 [Drosophila ficusphila]|uniref:uncharacterized protein LOC108100216 n=1 Tax=Drosophila ficusphila TaxID=30025 RepID=UPI0007E5E89B|nr:uncharacterized protein LOC108100216 [Drosophila ficusphila]
MQVINGFKLLAIGIFFLLLACNFQSQAVDEKPKDVGSVEPSTLTFWERIVSGVKNYPWKSDKIEKESPETAQRRNLFWQRLTMSTVL